MGEPALRERRAQVRGLLVLAALVFAALLWRGRALIPHAWWRF